MSSYQHLYNYAQTLSPVVSRKQIHPKICEILRCSPVRFYRDGLNTERLRGYFLSPRNDNHPFARQSNGRAVVVFARELNYCWERFVVVKEMMHLFDDPLRSLGSGEEFESLLAEFVGGGTLSRSPAMHSEIMSFWMALGVLCPEKYRSECYQKYAIGDMSSRDVAEVFKIPEQYVPNLMDKNFKAHIQSIIEGQ